MIERSCVAPVIPLWEGINVCFYPDGQARTIITPRCHYWLLERIPQLTKNTGSLLEILAEKGLPFVMMCRGLESYYAMKKAFLTITFLVRKQVEITTAFKTDLRGPLIKSITDAVSPKLEPHERAAIFDAYLAHAVCGNEFEDVKKIVKYSYCCQFTDEQLAYYINALERLEAFRHLIRKFMQMVTYWFDVSEYKIVDPIIRIYANDLYVVVDERSFPIEIDALRYKLKYGVVYKANERCYVVPCSTWEEALIRLGISETNGVEQSLAVNSEKRELVVHHPASEIKDPFSWIKKEIQEKLKSLGVSLSGYVLRSSLDGVRIKL